MSENYASLVTAELVTDRGQWQVAGTLFHRKEPRIVQVDGFDLEAHAAGWMVVLTNDDVPGVIGRIGTLFGAHGINIAGMQLGRQRPGGRVVSILSLDAPVPDAVLGELRALPSIRSARLVRLEPKEPAPRPSRAARAEGGASGVVHDPDLPRAG